MNKSIKPGKQKSEVSGGNPYLMRTSSFKQISQSNIINEEGTTSMNPLHHLQNSLQDLEKRLDRQKKSNFYDQGVLRICIIDAKLNRKPSMVARLFGAATGVDKAWIEFRYRGRTFSTEKKAGDTNGQGPCWNQIFEFYVSSMSDEIVFKLWDDDMMVQNNIGFVVTKVSSLCLNGGGELEFKIWNNQNEVGLIRMISSYTPDQLISLTFDSEGFEQMIKDQEMNNNYLRTDIDGLKKKIQKAQDKKNKLEQETKIGLEQVSAGNKQIERFKRVYKEFGGRLRNQEMDKNQLMPMILDFDSTVVEVSEYLKTGGDSGKKLEDGTFQKTEEWPWKVMIDTNSCFDKWITQHKNGWLIYTFDKPILIRGYGLVSANRLDQVDTDESDRDPRSWKFYVKDSIVVNKDDSDMSMMQSRGDLFDNDEEVEEIDIFKWNEVSHVKEYNLQNEPNGFTVYKFPIKGKQRIVSAVKLEVEKNNGSETHTQLNQLVVFT